MRPLEIGLNKYEVGIFLGGDIVEVFRTDCEEFKPIIVREAIQRKNRLERDHPQREYIVGEIPKEIKRANKDSIKPHR